jgi:hypothetical protein
VDEAKEAADRKGTRHEFITQGNKERDSSTLRMLCSSSDRNTKAQALLIPCVFDTLQIKP